jgi:predicted deacylase
MREAHRFQRGLIEQALIGVKSVLADYGLQTAREVNWPGWRTVIESSEKTCPRSDVGGIVDMHYDRGDIVEADEPICTITNPFKEASAPVDAPFIGLLVGILENPVVYPGNPLCHLVELDDDTRRAYRQSGPTMVAD